MRCQAYVVRTQNCLDGQCYAKQGVKLVRWAPSPLKTQVIKGLCRTHKKRLEEGKPVTLIGDICAKR